MALETKTLTRLALALAVALAVPACRRNTKANEVHLPPVQAPLPTARPFDTLAFVCQSESLKVDMNGGVMTTSTATIHTFIDALANKYRVDILRSDGSRETEVFDGEKVWHLYPGDKTAQGEDPPWPHYKVWDQARPFAGGFTRREPLRGLDTLVMRADQSTYWVYKGIVVQSEMHGRHGIIIRNSLKDLKENGKIDPGVFSLSPGTAKEFLRS